MKREYDDLYHNMNGTTSWAGSIDSPAMQWLTGLAEDMKEKGKPPVWATVHKVFCEKFPNDAPKSAGTIATTVRNLAG